MKPSAKRILFFTIAALGAAGLGLAATANTAGSNVASHEDLPAATYGNMPRPARNTGSTKSIEDLKGSDWPRLSATERQRFVYTAIGGLERQGVFISRTPQARDEIQRIRAAQAQGA